MIGDIQTDFGIEDLSISNTKESISITFWYMQYLKYKLH